MQPITGDLYLPRHRHRAATWALAMSFVGAALAAELQEPLTLSSDNGVLDILLVAKAAPIRTLPSTPTGWIYEICRRPPNNATSCPQAPSGPNYYGGTLLHLEKGDTLKVHLVNQLPRVLDSKHAQEPGEEFLALNPTNIHTHGMLVSPHYPSASDPTYGDNVFVLTFNSANGHPTSSPHMHADVRYDFTDYSIKLPANHPSGLFWFHPHAHGLALNQVTAGMGGIITVGSLADYVCKRAGCAGFASTIGVHHIILKDTQILPSGGLQDQEDPNFCSPTPMPGEGPRQGSCAGQDNSAGGGKDYTAGKWFFTLNGQPYPTIPIHTGSGEIWRITNVSGSATYDLNLWNPSQKRNMMVQILSVDGVSVSPTAGMSQSQIAQIGGAKFVPTRCPGIVRKSEDESEDEDNNASPVCTRRLHMMPSSRIEVWVAWRDANDALASPQAGANAVFRTAGYQTGPSGDSWPSVDLARVEFRGSRAGGDPKALKIKGEANDMAEPVRLSDDVRPANQAVAPDPTCKALPPGHLRRIFYAVPTTNLSAFGLAYEEVDEHGQVVGPAATDVTPFDPMYPTICVPLGPGNSPTKERWQLVNLATEDHNFHLHQVKFRVLTKDEVAGTVVPNRVFGRGVMLDNIPLAHANGTCGNNPPDDPSNPIADWRTGACQVTPITVEIPFTIAGDFVYHCHILEHEDGGMMARIRVRPN